MSAVALAYNLLIFSLREPGPNLFPQLLFQTTMLQHTRLVSFRVQESPTQPQNHPLIVLAMNKAKCSVKSRDESLVCSLLFCPEPNEPNFVACGIRVIQEKK